VGLITALQLANHGVKSILVERNLETTKWPKMDITNVRSMELLRWMGLADELRKVGVPGNYSFDVLFSTGLGDKGEIITKWVRDPERCGMSQSAGRRLMSRRIFSRPTNGGR